MPAIAFGGGAVGVVHLALVMCDTKLNNSVWFKGARLGNSQSCWIWCGSVKDISFWRVAELSVHPKCGCVLSKIEAFKRVVVLFCAWNLTVLVMCLGRVRLGCEYRQSIAYIGAFTEKVVVEVCRRNPTNIGCSIMRTNREDFWWIWLYRWYNEE